MNVLIAMDSFKGALSSERAGKALERGILRTSGHQTTVCSVADGGEGSVHALAACVKGEYKTWGKPVLCCGGRGYLRAA